MATQKQAQQTLNSGGRIHNGIQVNASGGLRTDVKGRLSKKQVSAIARKNPGAPITETR